MLNKIIRLFRKRDTENVRLNALLAGENSSEFTCKCGKTKGWITENTETQSCPKCSRKYIGYYDRKNLTIAGREIAC